MLELMISKPAQTYGTSVPSPFIVSNLLWSMDSSSSTEFQNDAKQQNISQISCFKIEFLFGEFYVKVLF